VAEAVDAIRRERFDVFHGLHIPGVVAPKPRPAQRSIPTW
jgi:hypothetical protein